MFYPDDPNGPLPSPGRFKNSVDGYQQKMAVSRGLEMTELHYWLVSAERFTCRYNFQFSYSERLVDAVISPSKGPWSFNMQVNLSPLITWTTFYQCSRASHRRPGYSHLVQYILTILLGVTTLSRDKTTKHWKPQRHPLSLVTVPVSGLYVSISSLHEEGAG